MNADDFNDSCCDDDGGENDQVPCKWHVICKKNACSDIRIREREVDLGRQLEQMMWDSWQP